MIGSRVCFPRISPRAWEHPADRAALTALRKVPALDTLARRSVALLGDRRLRLMHLASAVRVGPNQFPRVYTLFRESLQILDAEREPELYVAQTPLVNAGAVGLDEPFIVLNSGALELFDDQELRAVIGHELGHALSYHALYRTLTHLMLQLFMRRFRFGYAAFWGVIAALSEWSRKAELSGDRAGLLCAQDPAVCYRVEMKLAGGGQTDQMSLDAFRAQAREYQQGHDTLDSVLKLGNLLFRSHPFSVSRLAELEGWVESGDYRRILAGEYPVRGAEDDASFLGDLKESARSYQSDTGSAEESLLKFFQDIQSVGGNAWDRARDLFKSK
ncbi:MAG: M48 family metallopeptidase [Myxococcota bacterium]|nr:M48 family metallopeptidase [Myxococcota bacterium]